MTQNTRPARRTKSNENDIIGSNPPRQDRFDIGAYLDFIPLYAETDEIPLSAQDYPNALPESSTATSAEIPGLSLTLTGIWGLCGHEHLILHNGTAVEGHVAIEEARIDQVKGMVVEVHGFVRTFVGDEIYFLRWKHPLSSGRFDSRAKKLLFPFSFTLPEYCNKGPTAVKLPASFNLTDGDPGLGPVALAYRCVVKAPRRAWGGEDVLPLTFHYLPRTRPVQVTAPSQEDLYKHFTNTLKGEIFGRRDVEVECKLSLPRPLVYCKGDQLRFMLCLTSSDTQALDLLTSSEALTVWLQRNVRTVAPARYDVVSDVSNNHLRIISDGKLEKVRESTTANQRMFKGVIDLDDNLAPHGFFPSLSVIYGVGVMMQATGFTCRGTANDPETAIHDLLMYAQLTEVDITWKDKPALLVPVGIATDQADAALPRWSEPAPPPPYMA